MQVQNLDHLNLSVNDFDDTTDWYHRIFGFELVEKGIYRDQPWGVLRANRALLCIYQRPGAEHYSGETLRNKNLQGLNHFALRINDREEWEDTMKREKLNPLYGGPIHWPHSISWYLQDPTGYEIEIVLWQGDVIRF